MMVVQAPRASAILHSLLAARVERRPWLLPANICPIVPLVFFKANVPFRMVDISPHSLHLDLDQAGDLLSTRAFGGVLYAHTYGDETTPQDFFLLVRERFPEVFILDDRCLCLPQVEDPAETAADLCLFSTGYAKIVDLGFGGYAFVREGVEFAAASLPFEPGAYARLEEQARRAARERTRFVYRDSAWLQTRADLPAWYDYSRQIQAALPGTLEIRKAINTIYRRGLPAEVQLPEHYQTWRFNLRVGNARRILDQLFSAGLFASAHYASLAESMSDERTPVAESLAAEVINLFNDHHFSIPQAEIACRVIRENLP